MVNTKIRLIIFFTAKGGEALYSQQKQDQELTVAQIMNSVLPNYEDSTVYFSILIACVDLLLCLVLLTLLMSKVI